MHSLRFIFTADSVEDVSRHKTNMSLRFRETRMVEKGQIAQGRGMRGRKNCTRKRGAGIAQLPPTQASHQCGPGSIPGLGVKCGLSLLLVLVLAPRGFSPGSPVFPSPQKPTFPNSNSIWNPRATGLSVITLLSVTLVK